MLFQVEDGEKIVMRMRKIGGAQWVNAGGRVVLLLPDTLVRSNEGIAYK